MDPKKFADEKPGELVEIPRLDSVSGRGLAFVPDPLPPKFELSSANWRTLTEARDRIGTLNGIGQTLPDPSLLLRPLGAREAIASTEIEGTFVTPEQLLLFDLDPQESTPTSEQRADLQEVTNYRDALQLGMQMTETIPLGTLVIRKLHEVLMQGVRGHDKSPGSYRDRQVQIGSSARYVPPPPADVPRLMDNLNDFLQMPSADWDPLVQACIVHYQFEAIHPFLDGNGRTGRAFFAIMVARRLRLSAPWLYLSPYLERYRDDYFNHMFQVSARGSWMDWIQFCLEATIAQANDAINRCHQLLRLKQELYAKAEAHQPTGFTRVMIDRLFSQPYTTVSTTATELDVVYNTSKKNLDRLVAAGVLKKIDRKRSAVYWCPEILRIAYSNGFFG